MINRNHPCCAVREIDRELAIGNGNCMGDPCTFQKDFRKVFF